MQAAPPRSSNLAHRERAPQFPMDERASQSGSAAAGRRRGKERSVLCLPRAVYDEIRAQGEAAYPLECCGALLGRPAPGGWRIEALAGAANANGDSPRTRYEIAPEELVKIAGEARRRGLEIAGFYHSHPDCPAQWSAVDLAEAHWIGSSYIIAEIDQGKAAAMNAFLLAGTTEENKRFAPQTILIEERTGGTRLARRY